MNFLHRISYKNISLIVSGLISSFVMLLVYIKSGELLTCITFAVILFIVDIFLCEIVDTKQNAAIAVTFIFLNTVGFALAVLNNSSIIKLFIILTLSVLTALIFYKIIPLVIQFVTNSQKGTIITLSVIGCLTILLYLILFLFPKINGARAWIVIGSISIQVTEITKLLFLVSLSIIFTSKYFSSNRQLLLSVVILLINIIFLLVNNELGTAFVMVVSWTMIQFIFTKTRQGIFIFMIVTLTFLIGIIAVNSLYEKFLNSDIDNIIVTVTNKIHSRLFPDDNYQNNLALEGIINGGLVGASPNYVIDIPVAKSDYAFANLSQRFGILTGILVISSFVFIIFTMQRYSAEKKTNYRFNLAIIFTITMVVQMIIVVFTNTGILPIIGICAPFLSEGGSQTVVNYIMAAVIVGAMSPQNETVKTFFNKRPKRKEIFNDENPLSS